MIKRSTLSLPILFALFAGCTGPSVTASPPASPTPSTPSQASSANTPSYIPLVVSESIWTPSPGTTWQWQLRGPVDLSVDADVYDIDLFANDASVVDALHAQGRTVGMAFRPTSARALPRWSAPAQKWLLASQQ